jgi:hypothetical protein
LKKSKEKQNEDEDFKPFGRWESNPVLLLQLIYLKKTVCGGVHCASCPIYLVGLVVELVSEIIYKHEFGAETIEPQTHYNLKLMLMLTQVLDGRMGCKLRKKSEEHR